MFYGSECWAVKFKRTENSVSDIKMLRGMIVHLRKDKNWIINLWKQCYQWWMVEYGRRPKFRHINTSL